MLNTLSHLQKLYLDSSSAGIIFTDLENYSFIQ